VVVFHLHSVTQNFVAHQPVVEDHPGAPERPREGLALGNVRVQPVVETELHRNIISLQAAGLEDIPHWFGAQHARSVTLTKFRHKVFGDTHIARIEQIMRAVCADFETELVEFNRENSHVHLLVNFPPTVAPAKLVNSLKGVSSRRMRQEFPDQRGTTTRQTSSSQARTPQAP